MDKIDKATQELINSDVTEVYEEATTPTFRPGSNKEKDLHEEIKLTAKRLEALIAQVGNGNKERAIDALKVLIKQLMA